METAYLCQADPETSNLYIYIIYNYMYIYIYNYILYIICDGFLLTSFAAGGCHYPKNCRIHHKKSCKRLWFYPSHLHQLRPHSEWWENHHHPMEQSSWQPFQYLSWRPNRWGGAPKTRWFLISFPIQMADFWTYPNQYIYSHDIRTKWLVVYVIFVGSIHHFWNTWVCHGFSLCVYLPKRRF